MYLIEYFTSLTAIDLLCSETNAYAWFCKMKWMKVQWFQVRSKTDLEPA